MNSFRAFFFHLKRIIDAQFGKYHYLKRAFYEKLLEKLH